MNNRTDHNAGHKFDDLQGSYILDLKIISTVNYLIYNKYISKTIESFMSRTFSNCTSRVNYDESRNQIFCGHESRNNCDS